MSLFCYRLQGYMPAMHFSAADAVFTLHASWKMRLCNAFPSAGIIYVLFSL